jgi:endonuclease V-like protein UPF0215 family
LTSDKALLKSAARILGVAESGIMGACQTILGGVVMRGDLIIDGMVWDRATIRGLDSTQTILRMLNRLNRTDLGGIMLHGTVIAGYNIIEMDLLHQNTSLPIVSVTKQPVEDLQEHLKSTFPSEWGQRWQIAQRNGEIKSLTVDSQSTVFVQSIGCGWDVVKGVITRFTRFGGLPEPIRVARLFARAIVEMEKKTKSGN